MKNTKKVIALVLCMLLMMAASVIGTMAWLVSRDTVVNTFTVGDIQIQLYEHDTDGDSVVADNFTYNNASWDKANAYKLIPGVGVPKNPTVFVEQGSSDAYIRMQVTVTKCDTLKTLFNGSFTLDKIVDLDNAHWHLADTQDNGDTMTFTYTYLVSATNHVYKATAGDGYDLLPALFTKVTLPNSTNNTQLASLKDMQITVVAEAIQAETFESETEAWTAFSQQMN